MAKPKPGVRGYKKAFLPDGTEVEIRHSTNRAKRRHPEQYGLMKVFARFVRPQFHTKVSPHKRKAINRRRNAVAQTSRRRNRHGK